MIPPNEVHPLFPFLLAAGLLLTFFLFLFSGRLAYNKTNSEPYSIRRDFPFELFPRENPLASNILKGMYLVHAILSLGLVYLFASAFFTSPGWLTSLSLISAVILLTRIVAGFALLLFPAYYHKTHIKLVSLAFTFFGIETCTFFLFASKVMRPIGTGVSGLFALIASILVIVFDFSMLNPKYANWTSYESKEENGEKVVSRPKNFPLAAAEWRFYILSMVVDICLYLSIGFYILGY